MKSLEELDDLTLVPVMILEVATIAGFAASDLDQFKVGKKTCFPGIGLVTLEKLHKRAQLISAPDGRPYLRAPVSLPHADVELFFDIEVDPMRDVCYPPWFQMA